MSLLPFDDDAFAPPLDLLTAPPAPDDMFQLAGSVGLGGENDRADVIKTQVMLGNSGDFDLAGLGAPTGWPGGDLTQGIRAFQKRNGLTEDGLILPVPADGVTEDGAGETLEAMRGELRRMKGYAVPTPQDVDRHWQVAARDPDTLSDVAPSPIVVAQANPDKLPLGVLRPPLPQSKPGPRPFAPAVDLKDGADSHDELAAPPSDKRGLFKDNTDWTDYRAGVHALKDLGRHEEFAMMQSFGYEGGLKEDPKSKAYGGILPSTLAKAKASGKVPGLENIQAPSQLDPAKHAEVIRWHNGTALENAGGIKALEALGDKYVAAALNDTLYQHGEDGAKRILLQAVNDVRKAQDQPEIRNSESRISKNLFNAYKTLTDDPSTRGAMLDALSDQRLQVLKDAASRKKVPDEKVAPGELPRLDYFTFRRYRP